MLIIINNNNNNNNNNNPPRNLFENNAKYESKRSRNDVVIALMYLSDLRLSNVEISVAHAASSVTEIAPKSPGQ